MITNTSFLTNELDLKAKRYSTLVMGTYGRELPPKAYVSGFYYNMYSANFYILKFIFS